MGFDFENFTINFDSKNSNFISTTHNFFKAKKRFNGLSLVFIAGIYGLLNKTYTPF
ncbi:MAG: hypothetical protein MR902_09545 [Campylobacter sp.]|nr:hypothetical protein [Campylobacter sp.]